MDCVFALFYYPQTLPFALATYAVNALRFKMFNVIIYY
jgi:hypothetical protein